MKVKYRDYLFEGYFESFGYAEPYFKRIKKGSKYKYVSKMISQKGRVVWRSKVLGASKYFDTEKEAAKWVDLRLIEKGKEPLNILVRK